MNAKAWAISSGFFAKAFYAPALAFRLRLSASAACNVSAIRSFFNGMRYGFRDAFVED